MAKNWRLISVMCLMFGLVGDTMTLPDDDTPLLPPLAEFHEPESRNKWIKWNSEIKAIQIEICLQIQSFTLGKEFYRSKILFIVAFKAI